MNYFKKYVVYLSFISSISVVFAQVNDRQVRDLMNLFGNVIYSLAPILVTTAVLAFFWFLIKFIWMASDNPEAQSKAKSGIFYSIFAIFVMVSIWGIVAFMQSTLGIDGNTKAPVVNPLPPNMR